MILLWSAKMCSIAAAAGACIVIVALTAVCIAEYGYEEECVCVPQNKCLDNDTAVNGQGLFDIRYEAKQCSSYFEVCCENPAPNHPSAKLPARPFAQNLTPNPPAPPRPAAAPAACGLQPALAPRIMGDLLTAKFAELPWTLALLVREPNLNALKYKCGASLIHPQVALTVAHCVDGSQPQELAIRAGEWNTKSRSEPLPHQDRPVKEVLIHPYFQAGTLRNDIALLILSEPVTLAENVGTVCIPSAKVRLSYKCVASGWGKDAFVSGRHSSILKKVELPLVSRADCTEALRKTRLGWFYRLHKSFICAGGEPSKDTCIGDGGSPLVCSMKELDNRYAQVGMVSWGIGCGESDVPGVYVNVALYRGWIDKETAARGLDNSYYTYK